MAKFFLRAVGICASIGIYCVVIASFCRIMRPIDDEYYFPIRPNDALVAIVIFDLWYWCSFFGVLIACFVGGLPHLLPALGIVLALFVVVALTLRLFLDWMVRLNKKHPE